MTEIRKNSNSKTVITLNTATNLQILLYRRLQKRDLKNSDNDREDCIYLGYGANYPRYNFSMDVTYSICQEALEQIIDACLYNLSSIISAKGIETTTSPYKSLHDIHTAINELEEKIASLNSIIDEIEEDNEELIRRNTDLENKLKEISSN